MGLLFLLVNEVTMVNKFKVGDRVMVTHKMEGPTEEWSNCWVEDMDEQIGKVGVIERICFSGIKLVGHYYEFPPQALQFIDPEPIQYHGFKVGERVGVVSGGRVGTVIRWSEATHEGQDWCKEDYIPVREDETGRTNGWHYSGVERVDAKSSVDAAIAAYTLACEAFEEKQKELEQAKANVHNARLELRDALDCE